MSSAMRVLGLPCKGLACALLLVALQWNHPFAQAQRRSATNASAADRPRLVVQLGHSGVVTSIAPSPDGRHVLTGSGDRTARLWELETGAEVRQFRGHRDEINAVAYSPDGRYVLTGSGPASKELGKGDNTARLWEVETGKEVRRFEGHADRVTSVKFSPDVKYVLTGSRDNTVRLWEVTTGKELRRFAGAPIFEVTSVAFSPDGRYVVAASFHPTVGFWESATGRLVRSFKIYSDKQRPVPTVSLAFSADGKYLLTGSWDAARIWEVETSKEIRRFQGHSQILTGVAYSPDGRYVVTGSADKAMRLWEADTGREIHRFEALPYRITSVAFSPDGHYVMAGSQDGVVHLWEASTGKEAHTLEGVSNSVNSVALSRDGRFILTGNGALKAACLWEAEAGKEAYRFQVHIPGVLSAALSPDGRYALTGSRDGSVRLWETASGKEVNSFGPPLQAGAVALQKPASFSPDGRYVLAGVGAEARMWETGSGKEVRRFLGHRAAVASVCFSPDGRYVLTGGWDNTARLYEADTGKQVRVITADSDFFGDAAFSPDGRHILTGHHYMMAAEHYGKALRLWEADTGKEVRRYEGNTSFVESVAFSPDGRYVLAGTEDGIARMWETETGKLAHTLAGHLDKITSVTFSPDGRFVLTAGQDGTARLWNAPTGQELCQLISLRDGAWAVVDAEGRFDTNNLEEIRALHWIMPDDPMRPLPLEIFMRDYYEPRLLTRTLNGEKFKALQSIATLNRVQPQVSITEISRQKDSPDLATVTVKVAKSSGEFKQGDKKVTRATDVYDLRLFRDGQLVAQAPQVISAAVPATQLGLTPQQQRQAWRDATRVRLNANAERIITFNNIRLPRGAGTRQVEFSAYAFNEDRVKSPTSRKTYDLPKDLAPVKGRAFIVTVGVNSFQNSAWDLRFAANDVRLAQRMFAEGLRRSGEFADVIEAPLISDGKAAGGVKPATRANIKAALGQVARQAGPGDVLIIYYSSHGYSDRDGNFYFFPTDIGPGRGKEITPALLRRLISSEELSGWLRGVDAGEMLLVIDACQSAGTVKGEGGEEFKPGPMGSRGLGQLAYDKGMRILAASQADDFAFELEALQHGLLSFALMKDGIQARKADKDKDGKITLTEALGYSLDRVPKLYEATVKKELKKLFESEGGKGPVVTGAGASLARKDSFQRPSLFDFAKGRREVVLVK